MTTLAILRQSDSGLTMITATDDAATLAYRLAVMQPFDVEVFAEFPGKASLTLSVQSMLQGRHHANGWYAASGAEVTEAACRVFTAQQATDEEPWHDASEEEVAQQVVSLRIDPKWHELLEPCPRKEADKATTIRRTLKKLLGRWQTEAILSTYKETCLRIGPCGRYFVNMKGETLRLVAHASNPSMLQS